MKKTKVIHFTFFLFFEDFIYFQREGKGRRYREKHQCVVASHMPPIEEGAGNPGLCSDWELNWRPFGSQAHAQSTELHKTGPILHF